MARCDVCGNDYDKAFELIKEGEKHVFDCFECAIHAIAPNCANCGIKIIGHGVEANNKMYCGAHCAGAAGQSGLVDRT